MFKSVLGYNPGQAPAAWFGLVCWLVFCFCCFFGFFPQRFSLLLIPQNTPINDLLSTMIVFVCIKLGKVDFGKKRPLNNHNFA